MTDAVDAARRPPSIRASIEEYARGLVGGLLFSLPLLYTMEVWWTGAIVQPYRLLILLPFTYVLLLGYNRFAGIRRDSSWVEVAIDSVEELGLGVVTAAGVLFLLGRIGPGFSFEEILGKVIIEAAIVAIGFSIGTAQLGAGDEEDSGKDDEDSRDSWPFAREVVIAFCGAILFAANVAPTEEILVIAVETSPLRLLGLAITSFAMGSIILHFSKMKRSTAAMRDDERMATLFGSTIMYAVSLGASAILLWFFGRFDGVAFDVALSQLVVLGFPAILGASTGRFLLDP